jgi:hypothetical protein
MASTVRLVTSNGRTAPGWLVIGLGSGQGVSRRGKGSAEKLAAGRVVLPER